MVRIRLKEEPVKERIPQAGTAKSRSLSPKLIDQFCDLIRKGLPFDAACDYLGVNAATFYFWLRQGQVYRDGDNKPDDLRMHGRFVERIKRAHAEYILKRVVRLHLKKNSNWVRELAVLERRDRKNFGRNEPQGGSDQDMDPDEKFL